MFFNSDPKGEKFILIDEREVISDDKAIAECLNSHFVNVTDSLGLNPSFKNNETDMIMILNDWIDMVERKYKVKSIFTNRLSLVMLIF